MHQYPRATPWATSQTPSQPRTAARSGHDRDQQHGDSSGVSSLERSSSDSGVNVERARNADKVRQVVQQFFKRAALTILDSRVSLPPSYNPETRVVKSTKWFQLIIDDSDVLVTELEDWLYVDVIAERPKPLVVEIYLDIAELTAKQTLVLVDERGKKWDACQALRIPSSHTTSGGKRKKTSESHVVLERWTIRLDDPPATPSAKNDMADVYKQAIVLFRSLYTYSRFLPTWHFSRRQANEPTTLSALRPMYRIRKLDDISSVRDSLKTALYPSRDETCGNYKFTPVTSSVGAMSVDVTYRKNCDFRIDDNDAYYSSIYRGIDNKNDLSSPVSPLSDQRYLARDTDVGSLPAERRFPVDRIGAAQAYGSLSTFHQANNLGTSPMSALRAARDMAPDSPSTEASETQRLPPNHRTSLSSKSSFRSADSGAPPNPRRQSVSFQAFKAGSLSSSPAHILGMMHPPPSPSPSSSLTRTPDIGSALTQARNRTSLAALPQTALRLPQGPPSELTFVSPSSSSPKAPPITRYSSSFGHRRSRFSSGGGSVSKEEDNSSGKGSQESSKRNSGLIGDASGPGGSSGSMPTDDDNISDFLNLLEAKKDLNSFNRTDDASRDASGRRTTSALSRYKGMRQQNDVLGESMTSSMLHRTSTSSSQRLSGVPPTLAGTSVSTSSSPGKPISPHTPHTPAIPSRLSEQLRAQSQATTNSSSSSPSASPPEDETPSAAMARNRAIPIPTSPRGIPHLRRSSSAHQRFRTDISDVESFDLRPASLPAESPPADSREQSTIDLPGQRYPGSVGSRAFQSTTGSNEAPTQAVSLAGAPYRPRLTRGGSESTSSFGRVSSSRFSTRAAGTVSGERNASIPVPVDDEEPLLFTMSELGRRSMEDVAGRGVNRDDAALIRERGAGVREMREGWQ